MYNAKHMDPKRLELSDNLRLMRHEVESIRQQIINTLTWKQYNKIPVTFSNSEWAKQVVKVTKSTKVYALLDRLEYLIAEINVTRRRLDMIREYQLRETA